MSEAIRPGRREIHFPPFRLDLDAGYLRSGDRAVSLRPKTWDVLCYLAERPGVLVTKEELLDAVWSGISVTESTLTKSIGEIRDALHDDVRHPRFVETVHRRGFRFVSTVEGEGLIHDWAAGARPPPAHLVGRQVEIDRLHGLLAASAAGTRQLAFVTGEGGIGKTTLVEGFLASLAGDVCTATGQCVRRHSVEEPLMPVLEALGRLARGPQATRVVRLLREHAPGWLVQFPWLVGTDDLRDIRANLSGTTPDRMLRLFAQLVEELTSEVTLVLVLEDLHWADASTVDLVSVLAERPERARLLLLGTYRPAEVIAHGGAFDELRRGLRLKRRSVELALRPLPSPDVGAYLAARFGGHAGAPELAELLHAQTDGHPLFLVTAVDFLLARGWLVPTEQGPVLRTDRDTIERHVPGSLQELVELQVLDLDPFEVAVLEAASVAGLAFGAQTVAAALDGPVDQVEDACERLARAQRFLRASDTEAWPDGVAAARYAFAHSLYRRAFYHRLPAGRRRLLHQRIGERLEAGFAGRAPEVAVELAAHFERGTDPARAIRWLSLAAASAQGRFAPRETADYLRRAVGLLSETPDDPARRQLELELRASLGAAVIATNGFAAEEAWENLARAHELAGVAAPIDRYRIAFMLVNASVAYGDAVRAPKLVAELARVADEVDTPEARSIAATLSANTAMWSGRLAETAALETVVGADPEAIGSFVPGENIVVWAQAINGWRLWLLGRPEQARAFARTAVATARERPNPIDLPVALALASQVHLWCGRLDAASALVEEGRRLAVEHGFVFWRAIMRSISGGILLARGDGAAAIVELRQAVDEIGSVGVRVHLPMLFVALAQAALLVGRNTAAAAAVEQGFELARTTLSQWQLAELWRVQAELLAARGDPPGAIEAAFRRAMDTAATQGAVAFELRAATSFARWLASSGRTTEALTVLQPSYETISEGLETTDVETARRLVAELGA
jgi:DNA-binding winged helix-turn-helix (wHTH) protein